MAGFGVVGRVSPRRTFFGHLLSPFQLPSPSCGSILKHALPSKPNQLIGWQRFRSLSTQAEVKVEALSDDADSLENIGNRRDKIEVDGIHLNWDIAGTGDQVVALLPGVLGSINTDYKSVIKLMNKKDFTVVSWDPPGYGRSRPPDRDFKGIFYQRDGHLVAKLMEKLGYEKYSLMGCSNGGITAVHMAQDYPDRVQKLVTWGAHAFIDEQTVMFTKIMANLDIWSPKMLKGAVDLYGRDYLQRMVNNWHAGVSDFYEKGLVKVFIDGLPTVKCPILVLHGEDDPIIGIEHAEFLRDNIKKSRMLVIPGAKHNLHLKNTDRFVDIVEKFLKE